MQQGLIYQANTSPVLLLEPCTLLFYSFSLSLSFKSSSTESQQDKMLLRGEALRNLQNNCIPAFLCLLTPVQPKQARSSQITDDPVAITLTRQLT